METSNSPQTL